MAVFTQVSGTTQPVFNLDVRNGSIAGTANIRAQGPVQPQGPKLDFFSLVANSAMTSAGNVNGFLQNTFQQIQSGGGIVDGGAGGTVAMYQVSPSGLVLNIAIYPTGAYTTATLLAAAQQANATGGLNIGFDSCAGNAQFVNTDAIPT